MTASSTSSLKRPRGMSDAETSKGKGVEDKKPRTADIPPRDKLDCDIEDWEDLKQLYADAVQHVEHNDIRQGIVLLRGVLHECNRFLTVYKDPSVLFTHPPTRRRAVSPSMLTPPEERLLREWGSDDESPSERPSSPIIPSAYSSRFRVPGEQRTAFHSIYGSTLFLFGNLISHHPELLKPDEPTTPDAYFLAALEVFEKAEGLMTTSAIPRLPLKKSSSSPPRHEDSEDWQMTIAWGRTLVALANERMATDSVSNNTAKSRSPSYGSGVGSPGFTTRQELGPGSGTSPAQPPSYHRHHHTPFPSALPQSTIREESRSPIAVPQPLTDTAPPSRFPMAHSNPHDILMLAQDHFMRGIFHMPHSDPPSPVAGFLPPPPPISLQEQRTMTRSRAKAQQQSQQYLSPLPQTQTQPRRNRGQPRLSRSKTLYTIGIEVLSVAERFPKEADRLQWAEYADGVLAQLETEIGGVATADTVTRPGTGTGADRTMPKGGKADPIICRTTVTEARGRCCLIIGSAMAESLETQLEKGINGVLNGEQAVIAREYLSKAIGFLEPLWKEANISGDTIMLDSIQPLLAEAFLTLGNLTRDKRTQESLYSRAEEVSGDPIVLDDGNEDDNDAMDES